MDPVPDLSITADGPLAVAIVDAPPAYRHGLLSALAASGCGATDPHDALRWAEAQSRCAVLVVVDSLAGEVEKLCRYTRLDNTHVVALLRIPTPAAVAAAIRAGADGVCAWDSTTEHIVATITAAASGFVMLTTTLAEALTRSAPHPSNDVMRGLSDDHVQWLGDLARGCTVARLAKRAGYSERAMHRLLKNLYRTLGASNRSDALVLAARYGLLEAATD